MIRLTAIAALSITAACAQMPWDSDPVDARTARAIKASMAESKGPNEGVFPSMMRMTGNIVDAAGQTIGSVNLLEGPNGVMLEATVQPGGLEPGWHGLHLHQVGDCSDIGEFKRSGGHVGMIAGGHGLLNPNGPESGDVPNIWAAADGSAGYEAFSTLFSFAEIADEDGVALIIHENRDDHLTQPIGGAGPRVACAVIR